MAKEQRRPDDDEQAVKRQQQAQQQGMSPTQQANIDNAGNDIERMRHNDPLFIEKTKPEDPSGRPGQLTRDNVNPNIPSGPKERVIDECGRVDPNAGGIVDPNSLGMPQGGIAPNYPPPREELRRQRAEGKEGEQLPDGTVLPRSGSINEPPGSNVLGKTEEDVPPEILAKGKPVISSLEPSEAVSGDPDFTLVISGDNFFAGSVIVFGPHDEPTTFDEEAGTVSTGVKPSLFAPAVVPVKVRNGSLVSDPSDFTFTGPEADDEEADPDELEDEIEQAEEEGDVSSRKSSSKKTLMGLPVVTVASGGLPIVEATAGTPVTEATNGRGMAVTKVVGKPGMPVTFETIGVAAPLMATTFNPADTGGFIALSNGNLTVSSTGAATTAIRTIASKSTGKFYFEVRWTPPTGGAGGDNAGVAAATAVLAGGGASIPGNGSLGCVIYVGGVYYNAAIQAAANLGAFANNDVCCIAVDMDNKRFWARKNGGNWNGSMVGDPAANTGGINISTVFGSAAAFGVVSKNGSTPVATGNFGQGVFAFTIPSGFTAGLLA